MGGEPRAAFLSLALPPDADQLWVEEFFWGLLQLAEASGVLLAGGDTAQSPAGILADIVVLGSVPKGKAVLRSGAQVGDFVYVSGRLAVPPSPCSCYRAGKGFAPREPIDGTSIPSRGSRSAATCARRRLPQP